MQLGTDSESRRGVDTLIPSVNCCRDRGEFDNALRALRHRITPTVAVCLPTRSHRSVQLLFRSTLRPQDIVCSDFNAAVGDRTSSTEALLDFSPDRRVSGSTIASDMQHPFPFVFHGSPDPVGGVPRSRAIQVLQDVIAGKHVIQLEIAIHPDESSGFLSKRNQFYLSMVIQAKVDHAGVQRTSHGGSAPVHSSN